MNSIEIVTRLALVEGKNVNDRIFNDAALLPIEDAD